MKVLITGCTGQLGRALLDCTPAGIESRALQRSELNLVNLHSIKQTVVSSRASVVINAAAYTAVDQAEKEPESAYAVNCEAVEALAEACRSIGARLVHISTDFVFDGRSGTPYKPSDECHPLNVYGASKLCGEGRIAAMSGLDWRVIRTAWVYASVGRNFMLTMLRLFRERRQVNVVADQVGTPTSSRSLAECVWLTARENGLPGILHFTDAGVASWYDFAVAIYEEGRALGLIDQPVEIVPIGWEQYPTPARRPPYSVLDKRATLERLGMTPVHWRVRLREVLKELQA